MKEFIHDLDPDDLEHYRDLFAKREAGIMYSVDIDFDTAHGIELEFLNFQAYVFNKYINEPGIDFEEREWHIDEITGEVFFWG